MTKRINRVYTIMLLTLLVLGQLTTPGYAVEDMWTVANTIIVDVYAKIAGISTVLAGLMSAVAVVGAKISNNQHKVDQAWDWLKRIWIAWAIVNGIGAFITYIAPFFSGLATSAPPSLRTRGRRAVVEPRIWRVLRMRREPRCPQNRRICRSRTAELSVLEQRNRRF